MSAIKPFGIFLMTSTDDGTSYSKLVDIKDTPDLGGQFEALDWTTMSHPDYVYLPGRQAGDDGLEFTCNYNLADYTSLKALEGDEGYYAVWFGTSGIGTDGLYVPDGSDGKYSFTGYLSVRISAVSGSNVPDMIVTIMRTSSITQS